MSKSCTHPNCQKLQYKNVHEIQIHACTPNCSSLAWKTKKLGKPVRSARCAVQNVHCAHPNCQKLQYKNVHEIQIPACTPNYSSLAWKTKKLWKRCKNVRCAVQNVHCAHPVSQKIVSKNVMKSSFNPTHKKSALYLEKQKSWKISAKRALCSALCSSVRSDLSARFKPPRKNKLMLRVLLKWLKNWRNAGK